MKDGEIYQNKWGDLYLVIHDHKNFTFAPLEIEFIYKRKKIRGFWGRKNFKQHYTKVGNL